MTTHISSTEQRTDTRVLLDRAIATGGTVVAGISPDQLTAPTPCTEMDVRDLLTHLVGVLGRIAALARSEDPFGVTEAPAPDDQWSTVWEQAAADAVEAWRDDAVLEQPMALPWIQASGAEVLETYLSEFTVHTWDLATATDQQPDWDESVVIAALEMPQILPAENRRAIFAEVSARMGLDEVRIPFADAVPVPPDASAIDRLVAWNCRNPHR